MDNSNAKKQEKLLVAFLGYVFMLWFTGCIGWLPKLVPADLGDAQVAQTLQPLAKDCNDLDSESVAATTPYNIPDASNSIALSPIPEAEPPLPDIVSHTSHVIDKPLSPISEERPLLPDIITHTSHAIDKPLSPIFETSSLLLDVISHTAHAIDKSLSLISESGSLLPDIVYGPINNNQVATSLETPPIALNSGLAYLVNAAVISCHTSQQVVLEVVATLKKNFNRLQDAVISIDKLTKPLERRIAFTSEVLKETNDDLTKFDKVVGNDITPEALANIVASMRSIIQEEKKRIIWYETALLQKKGKRASVVQQIKAITIKAAKAEESVKSLIKALHWVRLYIGDVSNATITINNKEVSILEILTAADKESSELLKTATEQKDSMKMLKERILNVAAAISQVEKDIAEKIKEAEAVEKRIAAIANPHIAEPMATNE